MTVNAQSNTQLQVVQLVSLALWPASNAGGARARVGHPTGRERACLLISGRALISASATLAIART
jgi:hypothetical protein